MGFQPLIFSALALCAPLGVSPQRPPGHSIHRLDGSVIPVQEADSFAKKTLAAAHVTAVLNDAKPAWSAVYGLRRRNPELPMTRETTTWAASITKSVFSTYVMQLAERGEFDLNKPMAKQLSEPLNEYKPYRISASELVRDPQWLSRKQP